LFKITRNPESMCVRALLNQFQYHAKDLAAFAFARGRTTWP
jgi:hypothetical protein